MSLITTENSTGKSVSTAEKSSGINMESEPILVAGSASVTSHGHETHSCASMVTHPTNTASCSSSGIVMITLNLSTLSLASNEITAEDYLACGRKKSFTQKKFRVSMNYILTCM